MTTYLFFRKAAAIATITAGCAYSAQAETKRRKEFDQKYPGMQPAKQYLYIPGVGGSWIANYNRPEPQSASTPIVTLKR